jgi:hypothetical protein
MFYLFNSLSKEQFGPFTDVELWQQVEGLQQESHQSFYIWSAGWPNWKPLLDYKFEHSMPRGGDEGDLVREDSAIIRHIPKSDINKRKFTRFAYRMKCTVKSSGTLFDTYSVDISLGGIQLEHALPSQMLKEKCTLEIEGPDGVGKVTFTLNLASREEARYFYFSNFVAEEVKQLEKWLTSLSNTALKRPRLKA